MLRKIIAMLSEQPRRLFLMDGIGAIISAFMLGIVLMNFRNFFGIPQYVLVYLALIACGFALFSFSCYILFPPKWKLYLKSIATLNFIYCLLTAGWVFYLSGQLTVFGYIYFILEIAVIIILASIEWKITLVSD